MPACFRTAVYLDQHLYALPGILNVEAFKRAWQHLMTRHAVSEDVAYGRLRKTAMDKGLKISDVAQRIIDVADLLG